MPDNFVRYNVGSDRPPRLRVQHSLWSLRKLPMNASPEEEWTLDEKFRRVKEAGFEAVECWLTDEDEREHREALDRHGLRLVLGHRPFALDDVRKTVDRAVRLGADFVFAQPAHIHVCRRRLGGERAIFDRDWACGGGRRPGCYLCRWSRRMAR